MESQWFFNGADAYDPDVTLEQEIELLQLSDIGDNDIQQFIRGWSQSQQNDMSHIERVTNLLTDMSREDVEKVYQFVKSIKGD